MGAGCSNRPETLNEKKNHELKRRNSIKKMSALTNKKMMNSAFHLYQYNNTNSIIDNLIMFTAISNFNHDFTVIEGEKKEVTCTNTSKVQGVAVGYHKGYKLDVHNQDKFFIIIDGNVEIYCLLDGHGPFGNVIAQIAQDRLFRVSFYNNKFT